MQTPATTLQTRTLQSKTISSKPLQLQLFQANPATTCNFTVQTTISEKPLQLHYKQGLCSPTQFQANPLAYNNVKQTPATTLQTRTLQSNIISSKPLQLHTNLQCKQNTTISCKPLQLHYKQGPCSPKQFQANPCSYNNFKQTPTTALQTKNPAILFFKEGPAGIQCQAGHFLLS
jgi:hypothetical protein